MNLYKYYNDKDSLYGYDQIIKIKEPIYNEMLELVQGMSPSNTSESLDKFINIYMFRDEPRQDVPFHHFNNNITFGEVYNIYDHYFINEQDHEYAVESLHQLIQDYVEF